MDGSSLLSFAAFTSSIIAIFASWILGINSVRLSQNSNHLPVVLEFLKPHRSPGFIQKEEFLWRELPSYDKSLGFTNLPEEVKAITIEVAMQYQALSYISHYGIAEKDFILTQMRYRLLRTWNSIEEFVYSERAQRGGDQFLGSYQNFAKDAESFDEERAMRQLLKRGSRKYLD